VLNWPGRHNVENAVGALAACMAYGIGIGPIREALASFTGVQRRFDRRFASRERVYIDDYAHHPEELRATIESVRELYPGKKILGIFQPHLYSRTRDFADGFGVSLSLLDQLLLMDIYPARELPIPGIDARTIVSRVTIRDKKICPREEVVPETLKSDAFVVLTLGAGDIDQLVPRLQSALEQKYNPQTA
jgi:UDP-N-acetylmuramate--alanine ligase